MKKQVLNSRRRRKRTQTPDGVWVLWRSGRIEDTSQVKDLGVGGVFVSTTKVCPINATVELHFLVQEGEVRASAVVRHVEPGTGMGLQFTSVRGEDHERFAAMVKRLLQGSATENR